MKITTLLSVCLLTSTIMQSNANAVPSLTPGQLELLTTQATLDYHSHNYKKARDILNQVLDSDPNSVQALELLALVKKQTNDTSGVEELYKKLLQHGSPEKQSAYSFELATYYYSQKKFEEAHVYFEKAVKGKFNLGSSYFFLGVMDFNNKEYKKARRSFSASLRYPDGLPMKAVTRYYIANTYAQLGKTDSAARSFFLAAQESKSEENKMKKTSAGAAVTSAQMYGEIRKNALRELKTLDSMQKYLNLTLLSQYDSNVQTNPLVINDPEIRSQQRSAKAVFSVSGALTTSPVRKFQFMPSVRLFTNYNGNEKARDFNFLSVGSTLYGLYKPYAPVSFGLKGDVSYSMKNQLSSSDSRTALKYQSFSLIGEAGPVIKVEATSKATLTFETVWRPKKYYLDPATGDNRRSGNGVLARISADYASEMWWWSPLAYFTYEWDNPSSAKNFKSSAVALGFSNTWSITDPLSLTAFIDLIRTDYYATISPNRDDFYYSPRILASYTFTPNWAGLADFGYTMNESTQPASFRYQRFVTSLGASYTF